MWRSVWLCESHHDILTAVSYILSLVLKKKKLSNQAKPLPSSSKLSVFVVPLGNSECITGNVEVRRSRSEKSNGKKDLSSQKSIWWISTVQPWEDSRHFSKRGGKGPQKEPGNQRRCAQPEMTTVGRWFSSSSSSFFTVICLDAVHLLCIHITKEGLETRPSPTQPRVRTDTFHPQSCEYLSRDTGV